MIFFHTSHAASHTGKTTLGPLRTLYKHALKALDKKLKSYHHCKILQRYNLLTFVCLADRSLAYKLVSVYKVINVHIKRVNVTALR